MTAGTAAGDSADQIAQVGQSALQISTQVPDSAQDVADAMFKLSAVFSNVNDQQSVAKAMSELAASGFGNLNDIVDSSIQLFKDFGVTTSSEAITVLTDLMHGAEGAKESIPALVQQFTPFDTQLVASGIKVGNLNSIISVFSSEIGNVGAINASQIFSAITTALSGTNPAMNVLFGSISSIRQSLLNDGGLTAIKGVSDTLKDMGPSASLIATNMGLTTQQVKIFQENAVHFPKIATDAALIATNTQSIQKAFDDSDNSLRDLTTSWNTLKADLIPIGDILVKGLTGAINILKDSFIGLKEMVIDIGNTDIGKKLSASLAPLGTALFTQLNLDPKIRDLTTALSAHPVVNGQLQGPNFNNSQMMGIEQSAQAANLVPQLIEALRSGLSSNNASYNNIRQTFNLNVPQGMDLSAAGFARELYNSYQQSGN